MLSIDVPEIDASSLKVDIQEQKITITAKSPSRDVNIELNLHGKVTAEVRFFIFLRFFVFDASFDKTLYWPLCTTECQVWCVR